MSSMYCIGSLLSQGRLRDYDERDRRESTALVDARAGGAVPRVELSRGLGRRSRCGLLVETLDSLRHPLRRIEPGVEGSSSPARARVLLVREGVVELAPALVDDRLQLRSLPVQASGVGAGVDALDRVLDRRIGVEDGKRPRG